MAQSARPAATYADLCQVPAHKVGELLDGELVVHPRPAGPHTAAASALGEELGPPFKRGRGGPGGWLIFDEPELHLGADVLVPDLAGWHRQRLPEVPRDLLYFEISPDWACEVLSPSTRGFDRVRKLPKYAAASVGHVWLVDPLDCTLEVLQLREGQYVNAAAFQGDLVVRAAPFDAIELDLAILWGDIARAPDR